MRFTVLCDDAFAEAAIIGMLIAKGKPLEGKHSYMTNLKADESITHILCHPSALTLSDEKTKELERLEAKCLAQTIRAEQVSACH